MNADIYITAMQLIRTSKIVAGFSSDLVAGDLGKAQEAARHVFEGSTDNLEKARLLHARADIYLLLDNQEAAEALYAQALPFLSGQECLSAMSCRAIGLQMLVRGRLETAVSCFMKNMRAQEEELRFEALVLLALLFREAGLLSLAHRFVEYLASDQLMPSHPEWWDLGNMLDADIRAYIELTANSRLADHVFWHALRDVPAGTQAQSDFPPTESCTGPDIAGVKTLFMARRSQLEHLATLAMPGQRLLAEDVCDKVLSEAHVPGRCQPDAVRLEGALAALAGGYPALASRFLGALTPKSRATASLDAPLAGITAQGQVEFVYCSAKVMMEQGSINQGLHLYRNYLKVALRTIRGLSSTLRGIHADRPSAAGQKAAPAPSQPGILPPRYQLAYDYLMTQSHREDLSVHEIAASIGVSERALQLRFKSSFGCSPRDLIRQARNRSGKTGIPARHAPNAAI